MFQCGTLFEIRTLFGNMQTMTDETSTTAPPVPSKRPRGRRPSLSLEAVLGAAIELMDEAGHTALTFRALSARLGTGVGAIYHYVSGRDELLDLTTNQILGGVLDEVELPDEPFEALRVLSTALYTGMQAHTWAALYLMRDTGTQPNSLRVFETFGEQFLALGLDTKTCFDATSTLVSFVTGAGAEMREIPDVVTTEHRTQAEQLRIYADEWRALDADEFPFLHRIADTFAEHDDLEQFQAGVDLFLDGVRAQMG